MPCVSEFSSTMSNSFSDSRICRTKVSCVGLRRKECSSYISCVTQHADRGANIEDSRCSLVTKYNKYHFYQQTTLLQSYYKNIIIRNCTETICLLHFTHNKEASCWRFNPSRTSDVTLCWPEVCCQHFSGASVFKIPVTSYQFTWHNSPEDLNLHQHHCQNLKTCKYSTIFAQKSYLRIINI